MMFSFIIFIPVADRALKSRVKTLIAAALLIAVTGVLRAFSISLPYNLQLVPFWTAILLLGAFAGQYSMLSLSYVFCLDPMSYHGILMSYEEPVPIGIIWKSALLTAACLPCAF